MGKSRLVLAVSGEPQTKEMIRKSLAMANYQVSFISSIMEINEAIMAFKPVALVQDWDSVSESQARQFHYKFSDKEASEGLLRVIISKNVSPQLKIFAKDALIDDVMSFSNAKLNLGQELDRLFFIQNNSPLHDLLKSIKKNNQNYNQQEVDNKIEEAIKMFPDETNVQLEFGGLCLRRKNMKECQKQSSLVLHKEPGNLRALNLMARAFMKSGDYLQAKDILEKANLLSPQNPKRLMLLGDAFYGSGDLDGALDCYQQAKDLDSDLTLDSDQKSGKILLEQGEIDQAVELFKSSVSQDEAASIFNNVAVAAVKEGSYDSALELYSTALKALKTDESHKVQIFFNISLCYYRMQDMKLASKYVKKSLRLDPSFKKAKDLSERLAA